MDYFLTHPAYVHFPIAFSYLCFLYSFIAFIKQTEKWNRHFNFLLIFTAISFLPAIFSGYHAADLIFEKGKNVDLLETHKDLMMWSALCVWFILLAYPVIRKRTKKVFSFWLFCYMFLVIVLVTYGSSLGGKMVYLYGFGTIFAK